MIGLKSRREWEVFLIHGIYGGIGSATAFYSFIKPSLKASIIIGVILFLISALSAVIDEREKVSKKPPEGNS